MPNQAIAAHSKVLWRESSASGIIGSISAMSFIEDAIDADVVTPATGRVEDAVAIDWQENGVYELLWKAPGGFVVDGAAVAPDETPGTVAAILADNGAGGVELTTDLTREAIAELLSNGQGALVVVSDDADRLDMIATADTRTTLY